MNHLKRKLCFFALAVAVAVMAAGCSGKTKEVAVTEPAASSKTEESVLSEETEAKESEELESEKAGGAVFETMKADTESDSAAVDLLIGTVASAKDDSFTIITDRYPDGITFARGGEASQLENGLVQGGEITLFYTGDIDNGNTAQTTLLLIRDKRLKDTESQAAMISGKILAIGMSVITIETNDGQNISFEQDPKPVNMTDGPAEGESVTIIYSYGDEGSDGGVVPELIKGE